MLIGLHSDKYKTLFVRSVPAENVSVQKTMAQNVRFVPPLWTWAQPIASLSGISEKRSGVTETEPQPLSNEYGYDANFNF